MALPDMDLLVYEYGDAGVSAHLALAGYPAGAPLRGGPLTACLAALRNSLSNAHGRPSRLVGMEALTAEYGAAKVSRSLKDVGRPGGAPEVPGAAYNACVAAVTSDLSRFG